ncbi:MAG TPA: hypothetical protein VG675_20150 [Bryobacteraceae bacterium]|nr:hypothetical protein [Bryobacteraceae bacterium]
MLRSLLLGCLAAVLTFCCATAECFAQQAQAAPGYSNKTVASIDACPITTRPDTVFAPPLPFAFDSSQGGFYFGTRKIWAYLQNSPVFQGAMQKIPWWIPGFDALAEPRPPLSMTLERLDESAPIVVTSGNAGGSWIPDKPSYGYFIMTGVKFPSEGCWQVTGRYNGAELSFTYLVR